MIRMFPSKLYPSFFCPTCIIHPCSRGYVVLLKSTVARLYLFLAHFWQLSSNAVGPACMMNKFRILIQIQWHFSGITAHVLYHFPKTIWFLPLHNEMISDICWLTFSWKIISGTQIITICVEAFQQLHIKVAIHSTMFIQCHVSAYICPCYIHNAMPKISRAIPSFCHGAAYFIRYYHSGESKIFPWFEHPMWLSGEWSIMFSCTCSSRRHGASNHESNTEHIDSYQQWYRAACLFRQPEISKFHDFLRSLKFGDRASESRTCNTPPICIVSVLLSIFFLVCASFIDFDLLKWLVHWVVHQFPQMYTSRVCSTARVYPTVTAQDSISDNRILALRCQSCNWIHDGKTMSTPPRLRQLVGNYYSGLLVHCHATVKKQ